MKYNHFANLQKTLLKLGTGFYQYRFLTVLALLLISQGTFIALLVLINQPFRIHFKISQLQLAILGSIIFLCNNVGAIISGFLANLLGRKRLVICCGIIQIALILIWSRIDNLWIQSAIRPAIGLFGGILYPVLISQTAQIFPQDTRARFQGLVGAFTGVGMVFVMLMGCIIMQSLEEGNWKLIVLLSSIPMLLGTIASYKYFDQSVKMQLLKGEIQSAWTTLKKIARLNSTLHNLDSHLFHSLESQLSSQSSPQSLSILNLFNKSNCSKLAVALIMWSLVPFCYYGITVNMPKYLIFLNKGMVDENVDSLFYQSLWQLAISMCIPLLVQSQKIGKKKSLVLVNFMSALALLIASTSDELFVISTTFFKLFAVVNFALLYQITSELFPDQIRTKAFGLTVGIGRMMVMFMPVLHTAFENIKPMASLYFYTGLGVISGVTGLFVPVQEPQKIDKYIQRMQ